MDLVVILAFVCFGLVMILAPLLLRDDYRAAVLRLLCRSTRTANPDDAITIAASAETAALSQQEQVAIRGYVQQSLEPFTRTVQSQDLALSPTVTTMQEEDIEMGHVHITHEDGLCAAAKAVPSTTGSTTTWSDSSSCSYNEDDDDEETIRCEGRIRVLTGRVITDTTTTVSNNGTDQDQSEATTENKRYRHVANQCSICLSSFETGEQVTWSSTSQNPKGNGGCVHVFHHACMVHWLSTKACRHVEKQRREQGRTTTSHNDDKATRTTPPNVVDALTNFSMLCPYCRQVFVWSSAGHNNDPKAAITHTSDEERQPHCGYTTSS